MIVTTIMVVIVLSWSTVTLVVRGAENPIPSPNPEFSKKSLIDAEPIFDEDGNKSLPFESMLMEPKGRNICATRRGTRYVNATK